jgi:hypothetical protein
MPAEILKLPKKQNRIPKTIRKHRVWDEAEREQLRKDFAKVKGNVPKGWYQEAAKTYGRTTIAIMKQLHPSQFENYVKPSEHRRATSELVVKSINEDNPLKCAQLTLDGRWREAAGMYWLYLYGVWNPITFHQLIRAANVLRKNNGLPLIKGCVEWEP